MKTSDFIKKTVFAITIVLNFVQCKPDKQYNPALFGPWQGEEWLIENKSSELDAESVEFRFNADGSYSARFGSQNEAGQWYNRGDKLYTTAEGKKEIMTQYALQNDTLRIDMNRGGRAETLVLTKP